MWRGVQLWHSNLWKDTGCTHRLSTALEHRQAGDGAEHGLLAQNATAAALRFVQGGGNLRITSGHGRWLKGGTREIRLRRWEGHEAERGRGGQHHLLAGARKVDIASGSA